MGSSASGPAVVRAEGLSKRYPNGVAALSGLDLTVRSGELVSLLGRSGSGKTPLFRLLVGALRPSLGRLDVLGTDMTRVRSGELRRLRRRLAWVSQQHNLVPGLSAGHNVLLGRLGRGPLWSALLQMLYTPRRERKAAFAALAELGVGETLYRRADDLSGGQQQRVAVARALLDGPELLLADEPVASVDARTAEDVLSAFIRLNARGATVLLSLHQPELALHHCRRILILSGGALVYDGPPHGIDRAELYAHGDDRGDDEDGEGSDAPYRRVDASAPV